MRNKYRVVKIVEYIVKSIIGRFLTLPCFDLQTSAKTADGLQNNKEKNTPTIYWSPLLGLLLE